MLENLVYLQLLYQEYEEYVGQLHNGEKAVFMVCSVSLPKSSCVRLLSVVSPNSCLQVVKSNVVVGAFIFSKIIFIYINIINS